MLGRFLELSIPTTDIQDSLQFYRRLGFSQAEVGEARSHPYAVVTDGRLCVGLHQSPDFSPSITFMRPELLKHVSRLEGLGLTLEIRRLGRDEFNEIGWRDESGQMIRIVEARTFSPSKPDPFVRSACGYFLEIALPSEDSATGKAAWEQLGFVAMNDSHRPLPHVVCSSDTIDIGLYEPVHVKEPTLLFEVDDIDEKLKALRAAGFAPAGRIPAPLRGLAAAFVSPEGTPILLTAAQS